MPMKKKKKGRKKAHHTNNMLALGKRADLIVSDAYRAGSIKGFYVQELLMQSEAAIRELESGLDWVQLHMFRAYMLKRVPSTKKETAAAQSVTEYMMSQFYSTCQGVMMTAATSLLAEYFHKYLSELPSGADVLDATKNLLSRLPSKYFAPDVSGYSERMLDLLFTDPISLNLFATTEWDAVLPGANLIAWSRNVMELIKSFIDEDYRAYLEADRDKILNTVASIAAKEAGIVLDGVVSELRAIGADVPYIRDYGKPAAQSGVFAAGPIDDDGVSTVAALELSNGRISAEVYKAVTSQFTLPSILYTFVSLSSRYKTIRDMPNFLDDLFHTLIFGTALSEMPPAKLSAKDMEKVLDFNTSSVFIPKDPSLQVGDSQFGDGNLAQFFSSNADVIVPPTLVISLQWQRALENYGYKRNEAIALCGYLEGVRNMRPNLTQLSKAIEMSADSNSSKALGLDSKESEKERKERVRSEVEDELRASILAAQELREHLEADRRKLQKEHRTTNYRAEKAEERLEKSMEEISLLQAQVARLQAENSELQATVLELSAQDGAEDVADAQFTAQFPSDIGKDIKYNVFGGPKNWVVEQSRRFPFIHFYDVDTMPKGDTVESSDIILLNTFVMTHTGFGIIQNAAKRKGIPLHYLRNKGINRGSEQILETYRDYMGYSSEA